MLLTLTALLHIFNFSKPLNYCVLSVIPIFLPMLFHCRYRYDLSMEEVAELARRAIYHATFRDGASGGVASGMVLAISSTKKEEIQILVGFPPLFCCIFVLWSVYLSLTRGSCQFIMSDQMNGRSY